MIIPTHFGEAVSVGPAKCCASSVPGRLACFDITSVKPRFALATTLERSLVLSANALTRHVMERAFRGARFARDITAAATVVAAAGH